MAAPFLTYLQKNIKTAFSFSFTTRTLTFMAYYITVTKVFVYLSQIQKIFGRKSRIFIPRVVVF